MKRPPRPTDGNLAAVLSMLGDGDYDEVKAALHICFEVGPPIIEFLIAEADKATTKPLHVYRLLDLTERIGGERSPVEDRHLRALMQHRSLEIRKKAQNLFDVLSPKKEHKPGHRLVVPNRSLRAAMAASARRWNLAQWVPASRRQRTPRRVLVR